MTEKPALGFEEIRGLLAHRFPILMVDRITGLEPGRSITALKQVSGNDIVFLGHFPQRAVWPGVLIIESLAQASALLFILSRPSPPGSGARWMQMLHRTNVAFVHSVHPGDSLVLRSEVVKMIDHALIAKATASVDGTIVARGEITMGEVLLDAPQPEVESDGQPARR